MEYSTIFVCLMGMGTVFFGLICLIILTTLLGRIAGKTKPAPEAVPTPAVEPAVNQQELIAAISAAIAEDLGTDITGIRILSVKKL
ncbi:MAG: OadG family protein [Oscillospiraceae bacterium]|nr:OadG family protein [Oscillospiraceae bacterium]